MLVDKKRKKELKKLVNEKRRKQIESFHYFKTTTEYIESEHAVAITKPVNWKDVVWEMHNKSEYMKKFTDFTKNEE